MKLSATLSVGFDLPGLPYLFQGTPAEMCPKILGAGFDAVELLVREPAIVSSSSLEAALSRHRLALSAIGTGGAYITRKLHLCSPDGAVRAAAEAYVRDTLDLAAPFGGVVILGLVVGFLEPGVSRETALAWLTPALNRLGDMARAKGAGLVIEPLNRYESNFINCLDDGLDLVGRLATCSVKLLADLFHMNIEEASIPEAIRKAGRSLGHVHFVDSNRRAPGLGHLDYAPIMAALEAIGYTGFLSVEALPLPSSEAAAHQAVTMYRKFFRGKNKAKGLNHENGCRQ